MLSYTSTSYNGSHNHYLVLRCFTLRTIQYTTSNFLGNNKGYVVAEHAALLLSSPAHKHTHTLHTPHTVQYTTDNFLGKNKDYVVAEHAALLAASKAPLVLQLFGSRVSATHPEHPGSGQSLPSGSHMSSFR